MVLGRQRSTGSSHLEQRGHTDGALDLSHSDLPDLQSKVRRVTRSGGETVLLLFRTERNISVHQTLGTLVLGEGKDGQGRHQEGEGSALDDGQTTPECYLQQSDDPGHEQDRGDDVSPGGVILADTEGRADDEGDGDRGPEHGEVVLETKDTAGVPAGRRHEKINLT